MFRKLFAVGLVLMLLFASFTPAQASVMARRMAMLTPMWARWS